MLLVDEVFTLVTAKGKHHIKGKSVATGRNVLKSYAQEISMSNKFEILQPTKLCWQPLLYLMKVVELSLVSNILVGMEHQGYK